MVNSLIDTFKTLTTVPEEILKDRDYKIKQYKKDLNSNNLFKKVFKMTGRAVIDTSDGVARCSNCHWEVHGDRCPNCNIRLRNAYLDEISSPNTDFDELHEEFRHSHLNLYGDSEESADDDFDRDTEDDAFIDDGELGEEQSLSGDSDDSSPVRRSARRRYVPTFVEEDEPWEDRSDGFDDYDNDDDDDNDNEHENGDVENGNHRRSDVSDQYDVWNGFENDMTTVVSDSDEEGFHPSRRR